MSKTMTKTMTKKRTRSAADDYMELMRCFPLRPIRTQADYQLAAEILAVEEHGMNTIALGKLGA